ncbi:hypothetical protein V2J09_000637 [Rumex salicifolius]
MASTVEPNNEAHTSNPTPDPLNPQNEAQANPSSIPPSNTPPIALLPEALSPLPQPLQLVMPRSPSRPTKISNTLRDFHIEATLPSCMASQPSSSTSVAFDKAFPLANIAISWRAPKKRSVAQPSMEVQYRALAVTTSKSLNIANRAGDSRETARAFQGINDLAKLNVSNLRLFNRLKHNTLA